MKIIVPTNNKGGVGKTKVSILLAEYFSYIKKKRVLAIDFDSQCNFSRRFLKMQIDPSTPQGFMPPVHPDYDINDPEDNDWNGVSSIANIFYGEEVVPYPTHIENLDIAPAHADQLQQAESQTRAEIVSKVHYQLHKFLDNQEVKNEYDVVIVDTAPSKGPLTISAIKSATHIIIPSVMEIQPVQGIYGMIQLWTQESLSRPVDRPINLIGILPNMYRHNKLHQEIKASLENNEKIAQYVIPCQLGQRVKFAEVDSEEADPRTIFDLPEKAIEKIEALNFCDYVNSKVFENE